MTAVSVWGAITALITLALWALREDLSEAHKTLAYLLVVLFASSRHGRAVGLLLAAASFFAFNFFLLSPYYTLHLDDPLDWSVLLGFLLTAGVAAQLFHQEREARLAAERWAGEVQRFTTLADESVTAPSAREAVRAVATAMRAELPVRRVEVHAAPPEGGVQLVARVPEDAGVDVAPELMRFALRERRLVAIEVDGTSHVAPAGTDLRAVARDAPTHATIIVPLEIRDRPAGVLCLTDPAGLRLDDAQAAFAEGLARYSALALERLRLAGEAERVMALQEADRLKDELVANVSHDLRTPLTTIRALASELRATHDERALVIEEEADRLNRLVTDLLDLSSVRAGALPLDLQVVAAEDVVGAALQRLAGVAGSDRVRVRLPTDGTLPLGRLDFVQTLRVLGNLLDNALRHAPGEIELAVAIEGAHLVFRVMDRGPGVPETERAGIFEPFARGRTSGVERRGGTGLGLAIARSLAEAQGGSVRYEPRPGGGSVFALTLPAAEVPSLE